MGDTSIFESEFEKLLGFKPFSWQRRLFDRFMEVSLPGRLDLPTGLGKTSVMAIWLIARAHDALLPRRLPRRLVYVVDRRAVVDQATAEAEKLREGIENLPNLKAALGLVEKHHLPISTLRGKFVDNREWQENPAAPAIIVGTVDMIGSRLLFSGYGVSRKMRPYHAGLLGADTLVVLDEAHLVPPFEKLLEAIETGGSDFGPQVDESDTIPPFKLLSLSATGGQRKGEVFRLEAEDFSDPLIAKRLGSKKVLTVTSPAEAKLNADLAKQAWALADKGKANIRCLVYCNSREVAEKTYGSINDLAASNKKQAAVPIAAELLVGARRVRERDKVTEWLEKNGFVAGSGLPQQPSFLIATSAGEVGIDLDADHMVCDLAPWERMVQRLGRVNRRGDGDARIVVIAGEAPKPKKPDAATPEEIRALTAHRALEVIQALPPQDAGYDASPGALLDLKRRVEADTGLSGMIELATTPPPLRPALTRPLVDAWSMTSLQNHTGRPDVAPWLRGWIEEEEPQTVLVWRTHLPVLLDDKGYPALNQPRKAIDEFFEAAPLHQSEKLETETWRVVKWLQDRAKVLMKAKPAPPQINIDNEEAESGTIEAAVTPVDANSSQAATHKGNLRPNDIAALVLSSDTSYETSLELCELAKERKDKDEKDFHDSLAGKTFVLDARLAGLKDGNLQTNHDVSCATADAGESWSVKVGFHVRFVRSSDEEEKRTKEWEFEDRFVLSYDANGSRSEWLVVDHYRDAPQSENGRSISRFQKLTDHQGAVRSEMERIALALNLPPDYARPLIMAARLHDEGKKVWLWQRAFNAPLDGAIYAKTKGPINQALLDGYRHEFGSLPIVEDDSEFKTLPEDLKNLVLHIVAAHHGGARPVIETKGCEDAPPSALEARARDVALRFARLQKIWGPWGLAWWETLLRAADQLASRENDLDIRKADDNTASGEAA